MSPNTLRVCFISRRFFPAISGMSVYAANLLRELVAGGHDVVMISQYRNDPAGSAIYGGGPPPAVPGVKVIGLESLGEQEVGHGRPADFEADLSERTSWPLRLALDTGHCLVTGERDPASAVREFAGSLGTVAVEDMRRGVHEHLPFGQGDMDIPSVLEALEEIGFDRLVCVELSRESHRAHLAIPESLDWLKAQLPAQSSSQSSAQTRRSA